jgi:hypothetical protein
MSKRIERLINRHRDGLRALGLSLTRRDRAQVRLLASLKETLAELEVEVLSAIDESERRKLCVDQE